MSRLIALILRYPSIQLASMFGSYCRRCKSTARPKEEQVKHIFVLLALVVVATLLIGCAAPTPVIVPQTVQVPVQQTVQVTVQQTVQVPVPQTVQVQVPVPVVVTATPPP